MKAVKLRRVGNSFGFTLPMELIEKYNIKEGEALYVIEHPDGFTLTPYDPEFEKWSQSFERTNRKYKNTLRALSK